MRKLTRKETNIISLAIASWGIVLAGSGLVMNSMIKPEPVIKNELEVVHKRIAEIKTNEIKLKEMEAEINQPLSVDVKDYLENIDDFDAETLKLLRLDTSMVKTNEPGTYTYTISYNKKKYNGTFVIKEKELPNVELTTNYLRIAKGSPLSTDKQVYIKETLTEEIKAAIIIDLTKVNTQIPDKYQYTVSYNGILYTGTIEVYEPQHKEVLTPSNGTEDGNDTKPDTEEENPKEEGTEKNNEN